MISTEAPSSITQLGVAGAFPHFAVNRTQKVPVKINEEEREKRENSRGQTLLCRTCTLPAHGVSANPCVAEKSLLLQQAGKAHDLEMK